MDLANYLNRTLRFVEAVNVAVDGLSIKASLRTDIAARSYHLSLEHHGSIWLLSKEEQLGSAFALLRPQVDAFFRGAWVHHCAAESDVEKLVRDQSRADDPPSPKEVAEKLEQVNPARFGSGYLRAYYDKCWRGLCSYTHGGGVHLLRRGDGNDVFGNYSDRDTIELLTHSNLFALQACIEMIYLTGQEDVNDVLLAAYDALDDRRK